MRGLKLLAAITVVLCLIGIAFVLGSTRNETSSTDDTARAQVSPIPEPNVSGSSAAPKASHFEKDSSLPPPSSGKVYRALDLLRQRPFPNQGEMITLDVVATPHMDQDGDLITYTSLNVPIASEAHAHGVTFDKCISDTLCIFEVIEQVPGGGVEIARSAGAIAVEVTSRASVPTEARVWDVEPTGTEEVTLTNGTVLQLPRVRFWQYH